LSGNARPSWLALTEDDLAAIARLDVGHRNGPDPATFTAS
jgi:hypothetical protein